MTDLTPREIVSELDRFIIGQNDAKRAVAVALRSRWRRNQLSEELKEEVYPKNILMIGPTGVGKTEISRRLAKLANAPFIKIEATKFTEVGYVGRDVEQIIRDLVESSILMVRKNMREEKKALAEEAAEERVITAIAGKDARENTKEMFRKKLRNNDLDDKEIELDLADNFNPLQMLNIPGQPEGSGVGMMNIGDIFYEESDRVATITLNRPEKFNAITQRMPDDLAEAVARANDDDSVHVIMLTGAGRGFCGGYDLNVFAEGKTPAIQDMPWDAMIDYQFMRRCTDSFMALWRSPKPVIAKINGDAVAGGSDIALCCDLIIMSEDARIGYPPARVWGCPTTAMWVYRIGAERAKRMLFTGDLISGKEAEELGLVLQAVPSDQLDDAVTALIERIKGVPKNQLAMMKMMVNQAYDNMGLASTQTLATVFDGFARHSPEGVAFKTRAETVGFKQAVAERDSGDPIPGSKK